MLGYKMMNRALRAPPAAVTIKTVMEPERVSRDIDSINSLDTAKMTLRWALERLRTIEEKNSVLENRSSQAHGALADQLRAFREREAYISDREQHYKKLEALLADYCKGALDLGKLLQRETEVEGKAREMELRRADLERELAERKDELERSFQKLRAEAEVLSTSRTESAERALEDRRTQLDKAYISRELSIQSAERNLEAREKAVKEMEKRLELSLQARGEVLERQYRQLEAELRGDLDRRIADWERQRGAQENRRLVPAALRKYLCLCVRFRLRSTFHASPSWGGRPA